MSAGWSWWKSLGVTALLCASCIAPAKDPRAAADAALDAPTPMNPAVRLTRLDNGLTVYVMRQETQKAHAALWLTLKAGSVLEDEDQRGVAHLIEHMAFNGTAHFPKEQSVRFLQEMGMTPGIHFNAVTGMEQTTYKLTVPTDVPGAVDRSLLFLRDVASNVSFLPADLEAERGVVLEEARVHSDNDTRITDAEWCDMLQGSLYGRRLPIGLSRVIQRVPRERILRFYRDWYRPDLMALVAVGDFDAQAIEAQIARTFGDLPRASATRDASLPLVQRDKPLAIYVERDATATQSRVVVRDLIPRQARASKRDYRMLLLEDAYRQLMHGRIMHWRTGDPTYLQSDVWQANLTHDTAAFTISLTAREGRTDEALRTAVGELASAAKYGFLPSELERVRANMLSGWKHASGDGSAQRSLDSYASELTRNFHEAEAVQGPTIEDAWVRELVPSLTLAELNAFAARHRSSRGRVITITAPPKAFVPNDATLRVVTTQAQTSPPPLPHDEKVNGPLLAQLPTPGKVVAVRENSKLGTTEWQLNNGVRVIFKPSVQPGNDVLLRGWSPGGTSLFSDQDFEQGRFADSLIDAVGAGPFSGRTLWLMLAGKEVQVGVGLGELSQYFGLRSTREDLETALQVLYLRTTAPGQTTEAFRSWKANQLDRIIHQKDSPQAAFSATATAAAYGDDQRHAPPTTQVVERVQLERVRSLWLERTANFNGSTFVVVGNLQAAALQPLVERYLGSLPSKEKPDTWKALSVSYPTGKVERVVSTGPDARSRMYFEFSAADTYSVELERDLNALEQLVQGRLFEVLRERMSSIYHVGVSAGITREPTTRHYLRIWFSCAPQNVDTLRAAVFDQLADLARSGVDQQHLDALAKQLRLRHSENLLRDNWWLSTLVESSHYDGVAEQALDIDAITARLSSEHVRDVARRVFDPQNYVLVVQNPASSAQAH